jgi:hypothetical protein
MLPYASLSSFVAINWHSKEYFKKKVYYTINPEYIKFVEDKDDNLVRFAIVMPSFSSITKSRWQTFPIWFFYHLLNVQEAFEAMHENKCYTHNCHVS